MREVKFKAFIKQLKWLVPVTDIYFRHEVIECDLTGNGDTSVFTYEEVELMQYTGLKDKNGVEIYEGDIILSYNEFGEGFEQLSVVEYDVSTGQLKGIDIKYIAYEEVIGNIYKNPVLIKR